MTSSNLKSHGFPLNEVTAPSKDSKPRDIHRSYGTVNPRILVLASDRMDANTYSSDPRQPLLDHVRRTSESSGEHQLSTLADQLGIQEIDAIQNFSSSQSNKSVTSRKSTKYADTPTVVLTQEQVETLIQTLEDTGNALRQLKYIGDELKPPRRPRTPKWIISHLLFITAVWQIMGILALTVLKVFTQDKKKHERSTFIWTITILVIVQALNLLLVFITSVKLTKQFMHHTLTKSFLGQSFLSMTLLFAGLYTLVYTIKRDSFDCPSASGLKFSDDISYSVIVFANMLYFSISTATLCGAGHIIASTWYAQLMSATQMLMSYVYFASVLSMVIQSPKNIQYKMRRSRNINSTKKYGTLQSV